MHAYAHLGAYIFIMACPFLICLQAQVKVQLEYSATRENATLPRNNPFAPHGEAAFCTAASTWQHPPM